jgi:hypothetical protein
MRRLWSESRIKRDRRKIQELRMRKAQGEGLSIPISG